MRSDETAARSELRRLGAISGSKCAHDLADAVAHCVIAEEHRSGDRLVRESLGDVPENDGVLLRQRRPFATRVAARASHQDGGDGRIEEGVPCGDGEHGLREVELLRVFEEIADFPADCPPLEEALGLHYC